MSNNNLYSGSESIYSDKVLFNPVPPELKRNSKGLGCEFNEKLLKFGKNIMQIDALTGEEETYEQFRTKAIRASLFMKSKGLKPSDRIMISSHNSVKVPVAIVAATFSGIIPTAIDPSFSKEDFKMYLSIIKPKLVFAILNIADKIYEASREIEFVTEIITFENSSKYTPFSVCLHPIKGEADFQPFEALSLLDTAFITFSSGTTGSPKPMCLSHQYFLTRHRETPSIRVLIVTPLHWISQMDSIANNIINGYVKIVYPQYDGPKNFCRVMQDFKVNCIFVAPYCLGEIVQYCEQNGITLPCHSVIFGGSFTPKIHIKKGFKIFPNARLTHAYGSSETGGISFIGATADENDDQKKFLLNESVGKVSSGVLVKIVDPDTDEVLGPNKEGEILALSPFMMNGYFHFKSDRTYDPWGFIRTGDIGYYDENKYIYIVGRNKDIIKFRGKTINSSRIESILSEHSAVTEAVVVGKHHDIDGDLPIAIVTIKDGCKADPEDIQKFVDARVDDEMKLRGGVVILDEIPHSVTGKPMKRLLQDTLWKKHRSVKL